MEFAKDVTKGQRRIGNKEIGFTVEVPAPFVAGKTELTEGQASALNQVLAENVSNNLRAKIVEGQVGEDGKVTGPHTQETAQALVDSYLADYEIGVRRAGSGTPRVTDPVEREARKLARAAANRYVQGEGLKVKDVDMGPIVEKIFENNKDALMAEGKKIADAAAKAAAGAEGLDLGKIDISKKSDGDEG